MKYAHRAASLQKAHWATGTAHWASVGQPPPPLTTTLRYLSRPPSQTVRGSWTSWPTNSSTPSTLVTGTAQSSGARLGPLGLRASSPPLSLALSSWHGLGQCLSAWALTLTLTWCPQMLRKNRPPECSNACALTVDISPTPLANGWLRWEHLTVLTMARCKAFKQFSVKPFGASRCTVALLQKALT